MQAKTGFQWIGKMPLVRQISGSIRNKLLAAFIGLVCLTIIVGLIGFYTQYRAKNTITAVVDQHSRQARLTLLVGSGISEAANLEKAYMLHGKPLGFEKARATYVAPFEKRVAQINSLLGQLDGLDMSDQDRGLVKQIRKKVQAYKDGFLKTVELIETRGHKDEGTIGDFRRLIHSVEDAVIKANQLQLQVTMLMMRRHEKDYLLRGEEKYVDRLHKRTAKLKSEIAGSPLSTGIKAQLTKLANDYQALFDTIVDIDTQMAEAMKVFRAEAQSITPIVQKLVDRAQLAEQTATTQMQALIRTAIYTIVGISITAVLVGLLAAFGLSRNLTTQVRHITDLFGRIGIGEFDARAEVVSQDELGSMASSLNAMLDNTMSLIQSREERDDIQKSIMNLLEQISGFAEGDLSKRAEVTAEITGAIADSFNTMAVQLTNVVKDVRHAATQVDTTSDDVKLSTKDLVEKTRAQSKSISKAITSVEDMAASIRQIAKIAKQSARVSEHAKTNAVDGAQAVQNTNKAMAAIRNQMQETARSIKRLGESSQEIGGIIQIINDIADRTSILAINASIQAAMAGDAGRGFAVVAEEVQRLAEQSASSTKQIEKLISTIQGEINQAGTSMEESIDRVVSGAKLADEAHDRLQNIESVSLQLAKLVKLITSEANTQAKTSQNVVQTMEMIDRVVSQTSTATAQTEESMKRLTHTSSNLLSSISKFKLGAEDGGQSDTAAV